MPDTVTTITNLITSPPGQIAAGPVLGGIVWKFFERVEAVLTDDTKLEIGVWLLDRKLMCWIECSVRSIFPGRVSGALAWLLMQV
jgi:hypothetical protein